MGALVCWCNIKQNLMCIPRECQAPPLPGLHTTNTKDMGTIGLSFCLCSQYIDRGCTKKISRELRKNSRSRMACFSSLLRKGQRREFVVRLIYHTALLPEHNSTITPRNMHETKGRSAVEKRCLKLRSGAK